MDLEKGKKKKNQKKAEALISLSLASKMNQESNQMSIRIHASQSTKGILTREVHLTKLSTAFHPQGRSIIS